MSRFVDVADLADLGDGAMKRVTVEGRHLLVAKVGGRYYSADDRCPHMGGRLSEGRLQGTTVICPKHGSQFDLATGKVLRWTSWTGVRLALAKMMKSPRPINVYQMRSEADRVQVDLE